eukprot:g18543.t1
MGDTHVLCTATIEDRVPPFIKGSGLGWVTAEYGMLPRATNTRMRREAASGKQGGRTVEIQRLIGRALRAGVDRVALGERQITVDCDVLQADGGTRCASITGGWVALRLAVNKLMKAGDVTMDPLVDPVSAISCGIYAGQPVLDLDYPEDSEAGVDGNFIMTGKLGEITEILAPFGVKVVGAGEMNLPEPEETEDTFVGNARIKAHAAAKATGLPALSDDSGITIDALDGAPGVYTADWAETDQGRDFMMAMTRANDEITAKGPDAPRTAQFRCTLVLAWPDGHDEVFEGVMPGRLVWPIRGEGGFGYDPMFVPEGYDAKCPYCDFNSHVVSQIDQSAWVTAYQSELRRMGELLPDRLLNSIFFGGGTPSLMHPDTVAAVIEAARENWTFANDIEISLEANPGSVEAGRFAGYRDAGGQTLEAWKAELSEALSMAIDHLSLYQLTIEDGTAFGDRYARGKLRDLPTDDNAADMYLATQDICDTYGLPGLE